MKAPFPYFGGKSRIASLVWERFGDVPAYTEPFFGSGAVLLSRPDSHQWWKRTETVNDADGLLANAWRGIQRDPEAVAAAANNPVNECDLHARHLWLLGQRESLTDHLCGDPDWFDAKAAGWWVWGASCWIGGGWCAGNGPWLSVDGVMVKGERRGAGRTRPRLGPGNGVRRTLPAGVKRTIPHLGDGGMGVNRTIPHLGNGRGVNRTIPHLGNDGRGHAEAWEDHLRAVFTAISDRLRRVRVCCGDWARVCGETALGLNNHPVVGVFLDPPYSHEERDSGCYATESADAAAGAREWVVAHGDDPRYRICLCGYDTEHAMPDTWDRVSWKAQGGYGHQGNGIGKENAARETLWFSPHCIAQEAQEVPALLVA